MKGSGVVLVASVLVGCAGGSSARGGAVDSLARLASGAVAREAQRDAPAAYAEFARALEEAERLPASERADRVREAELLLAWASTQARVERARARQGVADERVERARVERARATARAEALDGESAALERAANVLDRALSSGPPDVESAAAERCQQARLAVAAAALLGVAESERASTIARIEAAERAPVAARLGAAGLALREAESLLRQARSTRSPSASSLIESLAGGESPVEPRRDRRGVVLTLRALFDRAGALAPSASGRLSVVVEAMRAHRELRVRVESFALGADAARARRVAEERARRVRDALVARGVDGARIEAEGLARLPAGEHGEDVVEVVLLAGE
jgi:outer membrane protein OmpA-like peptidoglycan-associated protein